MLHGRVLRFSSNIDFAFSALRGNKYDALLQASIPVQLNSLRSLLGMLFSNFGLAVCAAGLGRLQKPLSGISVCPQVSPCETAVITTPCLFRTMKGMQAELMQCREISVNTDAQVSHGKAGKLELWSLFQAETSPKCTVRPRGTEDVASILAIAREHSCHFAILGGRRSPFKGASNAEGGITIDMTLLKYLDLHSDLMQITVGGGSLWADVYSFLDPRNLSATGTRNSLTGVAGSVLGGERRRFPVCLSLSNPF